MAEPENGAAARGKPGPGRGRVSSALSPYETLLREILRGELLPGEALTELSLAERLAVSRTPIREALTRLEQDGLLKRTSRGMVLRERSPEEILDIYEVRILLEADAARSAAERRLALDVITMKRIAGEVEAMGAGDDPDAIAEANREFHRAVWRAAHNEPILDLLQRIHRHLARYPATTLSYPGRREAALSEHRLLIAAIEARDGEKAVQASTRHFTAARDIRLQLWSDGRF
jgi:DNA-binding GntR family transcriptional regulator